VLGTNWLNQFTNNITALTTANGGALTNLGLFLLAFVSFMMLVSMVINFSTQSMAFSLNAQPLEAGAIIKFLIRLVVCCLLESYWNNPFPGTTLSFNHIFSAIAQGIVAALDQNSLSNLQTLLATAGKGMGQPSMISIAEQACYWLVQLILGLAQAILFVINISSFIFYAVTALFGPLFIPLYMTNSFRGKFFHFVEVLASFAMIRAVASAFIFVWNGFLTTFLQQTFHGDYSLGMWAANFIVVTMVFAAFIVNMLFIPAITSAIFGGGASAVGSAQSMVGKGVELYALRKG
jgi:type IV secretion system protein VirB6